MKLEKILEAGLGIILLSPFEDVVTGFTTAPMTAGLGAVLIADAFNLKL